MQLFKSVVRSKETSKPSRTVGLEDQGYEALSLDHTIRCCWQTLVIHLICFCQISLNHCVCGTPNIWTIITSSLVACKTFLAFLGTSDSPHTLNLLGRIVGRDCISCCNSVSTTFHSSCWSSSTQPLYSLKRAANSYTDFTHTWHCCLKWSNPVRAVGFMECYFQTLSATGTIYSTGMALWAQWTP